MATKEQLERALRNADKAGDVAAAKRFAAAIRNGEFDQVQPIAEQQKEKGFMQKAGDAAVGALNAYGNAGLEMASAMNRGAAGIVDFAMTPVNAAMEVAGSDMRVPSLTQALAQATQGNFMEQGLGRDVVRAAGESVPAALAVGGALRQGAAALPAMGQAAESVGAGVLRQMGSSTAAQDAGFAALSGAGSAVGREAGGEEGAMIGAIAAPLAAVAPQMIGGAVKSAIAGGNQAAMRKSIDDFAAIGEVPTVGMATGSPAIQSSETVSKSVMGGGSLRKKAESIAESLQKRVAEMANNLSTKSGAEAAGLEIKKGIQGRGGFLDRFRTASSALWNKSDSMINQSLPVSINNTKATLGELVRGDKWGDVLDNAALVKINKMVNDPAATVDFATLKSLRSSIGQKIGNNELISDIPRSELKRVYGALTQDIKTAAASSSPEALKAFERANAYTRTGHDRIDDYLERIVLKVDPDKVFKAVTRGGDDTKTISSFKRSIKPQEWEIVVSNVMRRMGRSNSGAQSAEGDAFSIDKFVTDWDKLGVAKKSLFTGSDKLNDYYDDLSRIARVASTVKQSSKQGANYSGTTQAWARIAAGTGLATGIMTTSPTILGLTAGSIAMNKFGSSLMSNPEFVKWLAKSATIPSKNSAAAIGALSGVANKSSADDAALIQQLAEELESEK